MRVHRRRLAEAVLVLFLAPVVGCGSRATSEAKPLVAASIHPLGALVQEIAGGDCELLVLLPAGASPHHFEPTPRAVADGSRASLVVRVGLGLDDWVRPIVREAIDHGAPEIVVSELVDSLIPAQGDEADHGTSDPHVWLDPLSMIPACEEIGRALARLDATHADSYTQRAAACVDSLRALDVELRRILEPARGVPFIATHNAWSYFCRRYGLLQADVLQKIATREPGPRRLVEVMNTASRVGAKAVFTEVQISDATARTFMREQGLNLAMLDDQGTPSDPRRDRYFDLLRWNARRIATALTAPAGTELPAPAERR